MDETRRYAASEAKRFLGVPTVSQEALFDLASGVLGEGRAKRCLELAHRAPLSRRWVPVSAVAALIVGTRSLGLEWWARPHHEFDLRDTWTDRGTPDALLDKGRDTPGAENGARSCLAALGDWIADDAADAAWGRPVAYVDLNDPAADDRAILPPDVKPGDRFVATWDPGCRIWVEVVERDGAADPDAEKRGLRRGSLGSRLDA